MFKKCTLLLMAAMLILLVGCSGDTTSSSEPAGEPSNSQDSTGEPAEANGEDIEITLPNSMVEGEDIGEELTEEDIAEGFKSVRINEDGSVTYTIGKSDHDKLMKTMKDAIDEAVATFPEQFESIVGVEVNDTVTACTLIVDREAYEGGLDSMVTLGVYMQASIYQIMNGAAEDAITLTVSVQDEATGEIFDIVTYPEALA